MKRKPRPSPLALARMRAGLTQVGLAVQAKVHPQTVSTAERGAFSEALARRFALVLGVPAEELHPISADPEATR